MCPVVKVIQDIRETSPRRGGWSDDYSCPAVIIGGNHDSESDTAIVCEKVAFHIMCKKMALARFELGSPDLDQCQKYYEKEFEDHMGETHGQYYSSAFEDLINCNLLLDQFDLVLDYVTKIESLIAAKVLQLARDDRPINISLPHLNLVEAEVKLMPYAARILHKCVNQIVSYLNKINISSLVSSAKDSDDAGMLDLCPEAELGTGFGGDRHSREMKSKRGGGSGKDDWNEEFTPVRGSTPEQFIAGMHRFAESQIHILNRVEKMERYHCIAISHLGKCYKKCESIARALVNDNPALAKITGDEWKLPHSVDDTTDDLADLR